MGTPTDTRISRGAVFSVRGPCRKDMGEYGNGNSVQLSVGGSQWEFVVEEELEVSL
jgi:hypothetical protein